MEGETAEEAAAKIEKRYVEAQNSAAGRVARHGVHLRVRDAGNHGERGSEDPGVYPALGVRMLNDVIAAAGGVTLPRRRKWSLRTETIQGIQSRLNTIRSSAAGDSDLQLFPGDSILVPRAGIVYVMGDVNRSGGYVLDGRRTLTVEEAMALAGGGGTPPH